jgi:hypothetical protein
MSGIATAIVGGAVIGGVASNMAAGKQADAANNATAISDAQYQQTREDQTPWRNAGTIALSQLGTGTKDGGEFNRNFTLADFQQDPGYDFRMSEGQKALERSASARGGLQGGGTLKALTRYGQDYASNEYGNAYNRFNNDNTTRFNRLASLAQVGQTANSTIAQAGQANANNASSNALAAGNARASGYVGTANAINSGLNNSMSLYTMNQMFLNRSALAKDPAADPKWGGAYAGFNNPDNYG